MKKFCSKIDESVNFIWEGPPDSGSGYFEARYVRRVPRYLVCYLSSQKGCRQACRMCHLTATKQTNDYNAEKSDFNYQALKVLEHYDKLNKPAQIIHFGFMARGEALANTNLVNPDKGILADLCNLARTRKLFPRYCISTIMPQSVKGMKLIEMFPEHLPDFYYSLYSTSRTFRKKWLSQAMEPNCALEMLTEWQQASKKIPKLHWAFIKDQNDSEESISNICETVKKFNLRVDFNIVRYNPFSEKHGEESSEEVIKRNVGILQECFPESNIDVIERVGVDVAAQCGVFLNSTQYGSI